MMISYARLILLRGVNLREDEELVVNAPVSAQDFVRILVREAYHTFKSGMVHVNWNDPYLSRYAYAHAKEHVLTDVPDYVTRRMENLIERKAAFLTISTSFPDLLKGLDQNRIQKAQKAKAPKMRPFQETIVRQHKWSMAAWPSVEWAKKVYPDLDDSDALMQLFEDLVTIMRLDEEDPIKSWTDHLNELERKRRLLNEARFEKLLYKSADTDLTVTLPDKHIWVSGAQKRRDDVFLPNMPTEEVFTAPLKTGVNGTLRVTKHLNVRGLVIEPFTMELKYGEIVRLESSDRDKLEKLLSMDEGARFLGEVALVPEESPIAQLGKLFYHTLIDENASAHFAIGNAYPMCVRAKGASAKEIAEKHNINRSVIHVDFMVGSPDLEVIGVKPDGEKVPIFENGTWSEHFRKKVS